LQHAPTILSQDSILTTLSITHHTRKRPSTSPQTTHILKKTRRCCNSSHATSKVNLIIILRSLWKWCTC
jgi:hypothetical protein